jgi:hypothetical protein
MWVEWETLVWSRLYELRAEASTSWLERGFGKGTILNKQGINEWRQKDLKGAPYSDDYDTKMGSWYEKFEAKVGKGGAEKLLLQPLQRWIEYVKSELQLHENTTD